MSLSGQSNPQVPDPFQEVKANADVWYKQGSIDVVLL